MNKILLILLSGIAITACSGKTAPIKTSWYKTWTVIQNNQDKICTGFKSELDRFNNCYRRYLIEEMKDSHFHNMTEIHKYLANYENLLIKYQNKNISVNEYYNEMAILNDSMNSMLSYENEYYFSYDRNSKIVKQNLNKAAEDLTD